MKKKILLFAFIFITLPLRAQDEKKYQDLFFGIEQNISRISDCIDKLKGNNADTAATRNHFIMDVMDKEAAVEKIEDILLKDFMSESIAEKDDERLTVIHMMLQQIVRLKREVDMELLQQFQTRLKELKEMLMPPKKIKRNFRKRREYRAG